MHRVAPIGGPGAQHRLPEPGVGERGRLLPERRQRRDQHQRRQLLTDALHGRPGAETQPRRAALLTAARQRKGRTVPNLGGWELIILLGVLVLIFGAKKLPDMARSVGQSARVFTGEMKGLTEAPRDASASPADNQSQPAR